MNRVPPRDRPENEYLLIASEEERMLEHRERTVNRLLDLLRARYAHVAVTRESYRDGGAFGVTQFIVSLGLRCETAEGDATEFMTEIDVGSATRDADLGYFTASEPSDESLDFMLVEAPARDDPRQRLLFGADAGA